MATKTIFGHGVIVLILLFAGRLACAQTWSQDGPAPRNHTSAIYDSVTDQMVLYGGNNGNGTPFGDMWSEQQIAKDGQAASITNDWVQVFPSQTPPAARFGHTAIYDSNTNRMVVFGGGTSITSCLNEVWALDDANSASGVPAWLELATSGSTPPPRMNHIAVYDPVNNIMIVFGGTNCAHNYFSDVWTLSNANGAGGTPTWTNLQPSDSGPKARENSSAIYDSVNNVLTIYAGDAGSTGMSDVWTLSHANGLGGTPLWTQLSPTGTPPAPRTGQSSVYDSVNNRMIMYGGGSSPTGSKFFGDTWILTSANGLGGTPAWLLLKVTGTAPQRRFHSAFYSSTYNELVIVDGDGTINKPPAEDHVFVLPSANGLKGVKGERSDPLRLDSN